MSNSTGFTRSLGAEPGVQLNPLQDNSELPVLDNWDQQFAIAMRATRGRIDKPFLVYAGNVAKKLGAGEPMRVNALNEAYVQVVEALNNGAYQAVVQRLATPAAAVKWAVATLGAALGSNAALTATVANGVITSVTVGTGGTGYTTGAAITVTGAGTGAVLVPTVVAGVVTGVSIVDGGSGYSTAPTLAVVPEQATGFAVSSSAPTGAFLLGVQHLECFNDGIIVSIRADETQTGGVLQPNSLLTLKISEPNGNPLYNFYGSLDPAAVDDYGSPLYLPDVVASQTDAVIVTVGSGTTIPTDADCYGYDEYGQQQWATSSVLVCFTEGGTAYSTNDYANAMAKLQATPFDYAYIASGGTQSVALLAQLAQLAFQTNRQLRFDVPGHLTPDEAVTFVGQLNFGGNTTAWLLHAFWAPMQMDDPTGINPKGYFGRSSLNIALACRRNAQTDANGFAPKNYPIAGRNWPLNNTGLTQTYFPVDQEKNALANAKINPVLFMNFAGGGRYVYTDSLTSALVVSSLIKLIAVADMASTIDAFVVKYGNAIMQLPMSIALKRMGDVLGELFAGAQSAGWIVPSTDPSMNGQGWRYELLPDAVHPYDRMIVNYWIRYDGTIRQIFATQTVSR